MAEPVKTQLEALTMAHGELRRVVERFVEAREHVERRARELSDARNQLEALSKSVLEAQGKVDGAARSLDLPVFSTPSEEPAHG